MRHSGERSGVSPMALTLSGMALATGDVVLIVTAKTGG